MSNKTTLQSNNALISQSNTNLQALINTANALPDAGSGGSGGGSVETCTITITPDGMISPDSPTYWYTDAETMTIKSLSTQKATIMVPKNSIIVIVNWTSSSMVTGSCNRIFYSGGHTAYQITGDCAFKCSM